MSLLLALLGSSAVHGQDDAELVEMVIGFIAESDKDIRAIAFDQVRTEAPGADATIRFAAQLAKLPEDAQIGLLSALADRGDAAAKPAVAQVLEDAKDEAIQVAAIHALGKLGDSSDVSKLVTLLSKETDETTAAARQSLVQVRGDGVSTAIVDGMSKADAPLQIELIEILTARRALETLPALLMLATGENASIRQAAMKSLGQLAGPQHVADLVRGVLKADHGNERNAAEKNVMFVCGRIADKDQRAEPLLAAIEKLGDADRTAMLPTLGRIGGAPALVEVEKAIASEDSTLHAVGIRAISNWPDASVASQLIAIIKSDKHPNHQKTARKSLLRVAPLPDGRSDVEKLELLKTGMSLAANEQERNYALKRSAAIRLVETLRFVLPYLDQPRHAHEASQTIVELAHHRKLRDDNKKEFHAALDKVLATTKDVVLIDRANRYKQGQTWARPSARK